MMLNRISPQFGNTYTILNEEAPEELKQELTRASDAQGSSVIKISDKRYLINIPDELSLNYTDSVTIDFRRSGSYSRDGDYCHIETNNPDYAKSSDLSLFNSLEKMFEGSANLKECFNRLASKMDMKKRSEDNIWW